MHGQNHIKFEITLEPSDHPVFMECLLSLGAESFVFVCQFAIRKYKE